MRLRTAIHVLLAILATMVLVGAGTLILTTGMLRSTADALGVHVRATAAIESVQMNLMTHQRVSLALLHMPEQRQLEASRRAVERRLVYNLSELDRLSRQDPEHVELEALVFHVDRYLDTWEAVRDAGATPARAAASVAVPLTAALDVAGDLEERFREEVQEARSAMARVGRIAIAIAIASALLLALGAIALVVIARDRLYLPLVALRESISRYGDGEPNVRAPVRGPTEIREIAAAFNDVAAQLERHKSHELAFLAAVAHDLRSPLSALATAVASVRPDRPLPDEDKLRRLFALVGRQAERLDRMIGDLLDAARIEAGALELRIEDKDLVELVRDQTDLYRHVSSTHDIRVCAPDEPLVAPVDATRVAQVLNNLLSNAIKYSPRGGPVFVTLKREGRSALLLVEDMGVGIAEEELPRIFEPFHRSLGAKEAIPGAGLGLSVVQRIVRAHGGWVEVESRAGKGTSFAVRLPLERKRRGT